MKIKVGKLIEEMNSNIQLDIKPVRVITAIAFAVALPFYFNAYGHRSQFASLAYYFILFGLCMANYSTLCGFLGLPSLKGKLPSFSGSSLDTFFAYPLLLTALISIINSLLVATGTVPQDAQNLASYKLGLVQLFFSGAGLTVTAVAEEMLNLLLVASVYRVMRLRTRLGVIISILVSSLLFGLLHVFSWNMNTAFTIGISFIPLFVTTLYLKSIWVSVLAHFYNDLITVTGIYSPILSKVVILLILLPCILGTIKELSAPKSKSSNI